MEKFKQNLVSVSARVPFPLNSGGRIATYNSLLSLSKKYNIKLYIITDEVVDEKSISHLKMKFHSVTVYQKSKLSSFIDSLWFLFLGKPMQLGYFFSNNLKKQIEKENNLERDYFMGFVLRTAKYGEKFKTKKFIYSIDSMYLNYKNSVKNTKNIIWKSIYLIESLLLKKYELSVVKNFDKISYVNPNEANYWKKHGNVKCIPHGFDKIDIQNITISKKYENSIIFIGRMDYNPNIIAVEWFVKNVLNLINKNINLLIIGGNASVHLVKNLSSNRVKFLGFIENPNTIIKSSLCSIAPMRTGGGLQTKIIKSFSLGTIVVMSKLAAKPLLNFVNLEHGFISDTPNQYSHAINSIYNNKSKYSEMKKKSIRFFENNYENSIIEKSLNKYYS